MRRTVVLHPGALGDVLLAIPALRALRAGAPGDELTLAAQPRIGRLLAALQVVDRHVGFDTLGVDTLFTDGPPADPLRSLLAGARVVSWFGRSDPQFAGRLRRLAAGAIVAATAAPAGASVWPHLLSTVGVTTAAQAWRDTLPVTPAMVDAGGRALAEAGWTGRRPLLMLQPGAGGASKRWATEGFATSARRLSEALGVDLAIHDGPADHEAVSALRAHLAVPSIELVSPPLDVLAGAMRHAALWLGNDSGVTHLAAAVGAPTLALFVAPNLAWRPWSPRARVRVVGVPALVTADVEAVVADAVELGRRAHAAVAGSRR